MKLRIEVELNQETIEGGIADGYLKKDSPELTDEFRERLEIMLRLRLRNAVEAFGDWTFSIDHEEVVDYFNGL